MRVELKPQTVERIEEITGKRMTTRCDRLINEALDVTEENSVDEEESRPEVKLAPGIMEALKDG